MGKRAMKQLVDLAAPGAGTTTYALDPPSWTERCVIMVQATTGLTSTVDTKVQQGNPLGTSTAYVDTTVVTDQIPASQTAVGRYVAFGHVTAAAGTNWDAYAVPVSKYQRLSVTVAGTAVTNLKVWVEYLGS